MSGTVTGSLALALQDLEWYFSQSATIQARVNRIDDDAGVRDYHIFYSELSIDDDAFAGEIITEIPGTVVVLAEDSHGWDKNGQHGSLCYGGMGGILAVIRDTPREIASFKVCHLDFCNFVSQVIDEIAELQLQSEESRFVFPSISMLSPPARSDLTTRNEEDVFTAAYLFSWKGG